MAQQSENRRIVVETPNSTREVSHSETVQYPERSGVSSAALAAIVVGVVVLAAVVILFVMSQNRPDTVNANTAQQQQQPPQTTIVQQPAQQPPVIVQQPAPAAQQAPVIINQQPATAPGGTTNTAPDDGTIQAAIDKKLTDSPSLSTLGVTATVVSGKVTLMGTVKSEAQKSEVERTVRNVKGVKAVDNQLSVG